MNRRNSDIGVELLSLLRRQRCLYHQLRMLADRQLCLPGTNSPEPLLQVTSGRHKLVEKIRELHTKLRPIKANWQKLSTQIEPQHVAQAHKMANLVREIIGQIAASALPKTAQKLFLNDHCTFDGLFVEPVVK